MRECYPNFFLLDLTVKVLEEMIRLNGQKKHHNEDKEVHQLYKSS